MPANTFPFPQLQVWPQSGQLGAKNIHWAFAHPPTGLGYSDAHLGAEGVTVTEIMYVLWDELLPAVQAILGYSARNTSANPFPYRPPLPITAASSSPAGQINVTVANHGLVNGNTVLVTGVLGNTNANGAWFVVVLGPNDLQLTRAGGVNVPANGVYVAGSGEMRTIGSYLNRLPPWNHPYFNQLYARRIASVKGIRLEGNSNNNPRPGDANVVQNLIGAGWPVNTGPFTEYHLAQLTVEFWRPPYYIRSDADIGIGGGGAQEWLRWVDKKWQLNVQMLTREGQSFSWSPGQDIQPGASFVGNVGQKVSHLKVSRRWYEVPEACLFGAVLDPAAPVGQNLGTPNGLPYNLLYTRTGTVNPITGYEYLPGSPIGGCVNSPRGGGTDDSNPANRFFGAYMGTLVLEGVELEPRPLQMPPWLMGIPAFANNEYLSQTQYDVIFHFDLFDPPRSPGSQKANFSTRGGATVGGARGHNLMPFTGDGFWYACESKLNVTDFVRSWFGPPGAPANRPTTPFQYADFTDLFNVL